MPFVASAPIARTPAASVGSSTSINPLTKPTSAATIRKSARALHELVTINADYVERRNYARINLSGPLVHFCRKDWCSIQKKLGEEYCPSCARLSARDERRGRCAAAIAGFVVSRSGPHDPARSQSRCSSMKRRPAAAIHVWRIFRFSNHRRAPINPTGIFVRFAASSSGYMQYRAYPLWKRLVILGSFCDAASGNSRQAPVRETPEVLDAYREGSSAIILSSG